ncbi:MAG: hypothetical protein EPO13_00215 [Actinomycetota bacterium]|nr:MAG: hypothetical protein EPO13_00215 [Actinomycetota bacterium]
MARGIGAAALVGTAWAAAAGLAAIGALVLVAWVASPHLTVSWDQALGAAGAAWLTAHRAPVVLPEGTWSLLPLGLAVVPLLLLHRAGRWAARRCAVSAGGDVTLLVAAGAVMYALLAAIVAGVAGLVGPAPDVPSAFVAGLLVAVVGWGSGVLRGTGGRRWIAALPATLRHVLAGAAATVGVLLAAGALLAAVVIATHGGAVGDAARVLAPGAVGGVLVAVLQLAYLPVIAVWAMAFLLGPGFTVGIGTAVSVAGSQTGPVPGLPVLAAVPDQIPGWAPVLLLVPLAAGMIGGFVVVRRTGARQPDAPLVVTDLLAVGALSGVMVAGLTALGAGSVGAGRMVELGPSWWACGLAAAGLTGAGALAAGVVATWRSRRSDGGEASESRGSWLGWFWERG